MKARISCALQFVTLGLLASTSMVCPAVAASVEAQTAWAINRVASASSGSYCTMAQKYSDNTVVTLAKNPNSEYSLAFDFGKPRFDGKSTTVSLRPAGGTAQTFNITPQSDKVIVVGLGASESFINSLKSSGKMDLEVAGQTQTFNTNKFAAASDELNTCLSSMKASAARVASESSSSKTITAKKPVETASNDAPINGQLIDLKTENQQLKQAIAQERQSYENTQGSTQDTMAAELQEKLQLLQRENEELRAQKSAPAQAAADPKTAEELAKTKQELAAAQALNQTLQAQSAQIAQQQKAAAASNGQLSEMQKQNEALKAQIATTNQQLGQVQAKNSQNSSVADQLALIQKQNADLKAQLDAANQKIAQAPAAIPTTQRIDQTALRENAELKQQLASLQAQLKNQPPLPKTASAGETQMISALQAENAGLKQQLAASQVAAAKTPAVSSADIKDLQNKLELASVENQSLKKQIDTLQSDEDGKLKVAAGSNWDLEQATTRYQESQREIRRLGALVDKQQTQCTQQKKEIEAMLFDPAVSDKAQTEKFNSMETQIADLQAQLKATPKNDAKVAELEKKLADAQAAQASAQAAQAKLSDLQQQLAAAQASSQSSQAKIAELEKQAQSAQTAQATAQQAQAKVAELEKQAQTAQQAQAAAQAAQAKLAEVEKQAQTAQAAQAAALQAQATAQASQAKVAELEKQVASAKMAQERVSLLEQQLNQAKTATVAQAKIAPAAGTAVQPVASNDLPIPSATRVTPVQTAAIAPAVVAAPVAAVASVPVAAMAAAPVTPVAAQPVAAAAPVAPSINVNFQSPQAFAIMLREAGINVRGNVETVAGATGANSAAYRWKTDSLYGSAEQKVMKSGKGFDTAVTTYLDRAKSRCQGDFAAVPAEVSTASKAKAYEIACIGGKVDTSASVLFTYSNDVMTTIAHEGRSEAMDLAMEARDRMAAQLGGIKTASN